MTRQEFIRLAREMRLLQKQWFGTKPTLRRPGLLGEAMAAEKRFDQALDELVYRQRVLFDDEDRDT